MYKLFTKRFDANNSIIHPPGFDLVRRTYQRDILQIINYYHDRVYSVRSNHLLCRVLDTAGVPLQYDLERFADAASARSPYVAKLFNFTSEINYGEFFHGAFYGPNCTEIIIYNEDYFNPFEALADWKNIEALRVIDHPVSDLGMMLPNGNENSTDGGLAVITINLPLLLVQYRGFCAEQQGKLAEGNSSVLGVAHFIHMYVLPNMLKSHSEIVILNRIRNLYYGAPMGDQLRKHPFPIIKYDIKLDYVLDRILKQIENHKMLYYSDLKNIPSFFAEDAQEALLMPDIVKTRQVWWALFLSRLKVTEFLIDACGPEGLVANGIYINRLKVELMRFKDEHIMQRMLPTDMFFDVDATMDKLLAL